MDAISVNIPTFFQNVWYMLSNSPEDLQFNSGLFWVLFLFFLPIYGLLKSRRTKMMIFVIAFSLYFFYKKSGLLFLLLVATSLIDWFLARQIKKESTIKKKRLWLILSIALSVGVLCFFKYGDLVVSSIGDLLHKNFQPLDLVLPLGISYYTFKTISYVVDVYKGKMEPTDNWLEYLFYLSFFPALALGPIVRASSFLPQLKENKAPSKQMVYSGFWLVLIGVIKKAVFSFYFAEYTDITFGVNGNPDGYSGFELAMAVLGFAMQIYCDFSGYSDMAIGISRMMGFDVGINFDFPYRSQNVTEFWRRWHISLSSWLKDYVYIPLGGNRKGKARQYLNLMVTMLVGGMWHGDTLIFVVWGGVHGVALVIHKILKKPLDVIFPSRFAVVKFFSWLITFAFASITMMMLGAGLLSEDPLNTAWVVIKKSFTDFNIDYFLPFFSVRKTWCYLMITIIALHFVPQKVYQFLSDMFVKSHWILKLLVFIVVVQIVIQVSSSAEVKTFLYEQF